MPFLAQALDPAQARCYLAECVRNWQNVGEIEIRSIKVVRHKPGRRCLIEYQLAAPHFSDAPFSVLGKVRAKGLDRKTYELVQALWLGPFSPRNQDGIYLPEPIGVIPALAMWLQAKAPGVASTPLLASPVGPELARRIAEAICKLHQAELPVHRSHRMDDELRILHERLAIVSQFRPTWAVRLERLLAACDRLGACVPEPRIRGIHRDFYPAQVLVNCADVYLVDFDLFCAGDPALDIGNFTGHLTEQALRASGNPEALADAEEALTERFLELSSESCRASVEAYATLTLVRHIYLSTQFPERTASTEPLMDLCEQRLRRFL